MVGAGDPYNRGTYPWGREDQDLLHAYEQIIARRKNEPLWRRGTLDILAPHPDVLLVVRSIENGRDALGNRGQNGHVLFGINRGEETIRLLPDLTDPRLAPFAGKLTEITLQPMSPYYFKA